ncbi:MAG: ferredoxin--NADP reductase [Saprospiraceae bacterium]
MSDTHFYPLTISRIQQETTDTVTLFLAVPPTLADAFNYTHGQYLTLRFLFNGQEERRAYSMSSAPFEDQLAVTVKRVKGGKVSNHIHDTLKAGDTVEVMPPQGRFFTPLAADQRKTYYLFAAGSGITPLMSILKAVLEEEPQSSVHLLYGSRQEDEIIFQEALESLEKRYSGQLTVTHTISQPRKEKAGWFRKSTTNWEGWVGRISKSNTIKLCSDYPAKGQGAEYFICGPGDMIDAVEEALKGIGVDSHCIHTERFVNAGEAAANKAKGDHTAAGQAIVTLRGEKLTLDVPAGKTILDAMLAAKHDAPYSCMAGACSTCMAKVTKGSVTMDACYALDDDEVAAGYILSCQAHPGPEGVELTFDV